MESRRRPRKLSNDENNLQPPSKRVSRSSSPMTFPPPNEHGTSNRGPIISGTATQELGAVREMDVLYDPLESESGTRATPQTESHAITEYESSLFPSIV